MQDARRPKPLVFVVDTRPEFLKSAAVQFRFVKRNLRRIFPGVLRFARVPVIDGIKHGDDFYGAACAFLVLIVLYS